MVNVRIPVERGGIICAQSYRKITGFWITLLFRFVRMPYVVRIYYWCICCKGFAHVDLFMKGKAMKREVELHFEYENMSRRDDDLLRHELEERRKSLLDKVVTVQDSSFSLEEHEWLARSFPVLSILAPVMSTNEGKIEFPGDPMCL